MDDATRRWLYDQLGSNTDLTDLEARYTLLGKARAVAISVLNQRKADLVNNQPASVNISSVVAVAYTENIKALERQILALEAEGAPPAPDEPSEDASDDGTDSGWSIVQLIERPRR